MDFGDFLRGIEKNTPAQEQTKQDLLDIVVAKSAQAMKEKGYPCMDLAFADGREGEIDLTYWGEGGSPTNPEAHAEILLIIPDPSSPDDTIRITGYAIFQTPEGLGLSKYVGTEERNPPAIEPAEFAEIAKELNEYFDGLSEDERQQEMQRRLDDCDRKEHQQEQKAIADELGSSLVFEPEAMEILKMIREAKPNDNPSF